MMTAQTYNFVAKRIREQFPSLENDAEQKIQRGTLCNLAIECAKGFLRDNPRFEPLKFLEACSPDPHNYPIQELWQYELDNIAQNGS